MIPVYIAKTISKEHKKSIVMIISYDPIVGQINLTAYGSNPNDKKWSYEWAKEILRFASQSFLSIYGEN